jgi:hypothetical protein
MNSGSATAMPSTVHRADGLYPRLLGPSWDALDEAVRRLHVAGSAVHIAGTFCVRHGMNRLARLLGRLARLPREGEAVDVQLLITPDEQGEEWRRSLAGQPLVSKQWEGPDGLLVEHIGSMELRFQLKVAGGGLVYHQERAALRLGPLRLPLPRCCAPRVAAHEMAAHDPEGVHVCVTVTMPLLGRFLSYEGRLTTLGTGS